MFTSVNLEFGGRLTDAANPFKASTNFDFIFTDLRQRKKFMSFAVEKLMQYVRESDNVLQCQLYMNQ